MRLVGLLVCGMALLTLVVPSADAQGQGTWEFGVDLGLNLSFIDDVDENLLTVGVPGGEFGVLLQSFRIGYNATRAFEIESGLGFSYSHQGAFTFWRLGFSLDGLYNISTEGDVRWFVRGGGLLSVTGSDNQTTNQLGAAAGLGTRLSLGSQWALRIEVGGARLFENDDFYARWDLSGSVGFSFFTL